MKNVCIIISLITCVNLIYSQNNLSLQLKEKKNQAIYISFNSDNDLEYFVDDQTHLLDTRKSVNSKENYINIYLEWLNPLKYKLSWKDSTLNDDRDEAINSFINLLVGQFGSSVSNFNPDAGLSGTKIDTIDNMQMEKFSFKDENLALLLIILEKNKSVLNQGLEKEEIKNINTFFIELEKLDKLYAESVSSAATKIYTDLFAYNTIDEFESNIDNQLGSYNSILQYIDNLNSNYETCNALFEKLTFGDELHTNYANPVIKRYLEKVLKKVNSDKVIAAKIEPILEIVKNSTKNESAKYDNHFKIRNISFDNGEKVKTELVITEYEYNKETTQITKKKDVFEKSFEFTRHDIFDVSASVGIFYGSTTINTYGLTEDHKVTQDQLNENDFVTATFLNFNFNVSRYFAPLVQLGIDPTKKRPFFLIGGGFTIPAANIAFSSGPLWTWEPSLNKLREGEVVSSTIELEDDVKFKFKAKPKGWYLGIQYNF